MQPDTVSADVPAPADRLDSWKEIAAHLRRDVTTVQRWERREGLPVHRLVHARQGSVYAFKHELDAWVRTRGARTADERPQPARSRWIRNWRLNALIVAALVALVFLLGPLIWRDARDGASSGGLPTTGSGPVGPIAVAVLGNETGDPSLDGIGRLAAERLIRIVAQSSPIEVVPRPVEGEITATGTTGRSASLLVAGSYYRRESTLEFQVRILDASGRLLHGLVPIAEPQSRVADALDRLEQKVAGAIAIHFDEFFGGLGVVAHPPTLNAYREYRAGLEVFQSDYARSLSHLERARELDPEFLLPLVIMEFVHANLGADEEVERVVALMESMADRASAAERLWIEFSRSSLEGRFPQALGVLRDLERAAPASLLVNFNIIQQATALNRPALAVETFDRIPSFGRSLRHSIGSYRTFVIAQALHLLGAYDRELEVVTRAQEYAPGEHLFFEAEARALAAQGRISEVIRVIDRSLKTGPTAGTLGDPGRVMEEASAELRAHGHREASLQVATRAIERLERRPPDTRSTRQYRVALASTLYLAERWEESLRVYSALFSENPDESGFAAHVGQLAARTGDLARARATSEELARVPAVGIRGRRSRARATFERARIAALLGEKQQAVDLLRDAITEGFPINLNIHSNPDFESLRDYGPFVELTRPSDGST